MNIIIIIVFNFRATGIQDNITNNKYINLIASIGSI